MRGPGVVDDDVEVSEVSQRGIEQGLHVAAAGHVAVGELGAAAGGADARHHRDARVARDVVDDDSAAFAGESLCDALAEARSRSGDDGHFSFQTTHDVH